MKEDRIVIGTSPVSMFCNGRGTVVKTPIVADDTIHTLIENGTVETFKSWKTYQVDMEKVKEIKDVNEKLNALFEIFAEVNTTVQEYAMTDTLKKFCREII